MVEHLSHPFSRSPGDGFFYSFLQWSNDGCPTELVVFEKRAPYLLEFVLSASSIFTTLHGLNVPVSYSVKRQDPQGFSQRMIAYAPLDGSLDDFVGLDETVTIEPFDGEPEFSTTVFRRGKAVHCTDLDGCVQLSSGHSVEAVTIAFFLRPDGWSASTNGADLTLASWWIEIIDDGEFKPGTLALDGTSLVCSFAGASVAVDDPGLLDGVWTHIAITLDIALGRVSVFLDGDLASFSAGGDIPSGSATSTLTMVSLGSTCRSVFKRLLAFRAGWCCPSLLTCVVEHFLSGPMKVPQI